MRAYKTRAPRWMAGIVALSMVAPLAGCGRSNNQVNAAPPGTYRNAPSNQRQGMTRGQKLAVLAGAAALLYMYNKHKNAQGNGPQGRYYRSRNGGIYYRDANGNPVWVTPPSQGIAVPQDEAQQYEQAARQGNWNIHPNGGNYAPSGPPGPGGY